VSSGLRRKNGGRWAKFATSGNQKIILDKRDEKYLGPSYFGFFRLIFLLRKLRPTPFLFPLAQ